MSDTELPSWAPVERPQPVPLAEPDELFGLLQAARIVEVRVAVLIHLVATTEMRRGEACTVRWIDIDKKAAW